ncbi:helix-turn-helix transcriptional regulator [Amycolatopsis sp. EV170708-02-1]|uniref:ArsR/SmtB family transcription factor n=1 Tax=Amycolatopsis sp. EV170708-02-1 TaxID=2919322 RepID=UPI001F0CD785|nr:metalloregulator ArsR/SmtB family transcription factor [Amycolatopsis sp. EV170708-02-1]UMO99970.1 metalloregulator ArsR/SmtB family transcription factor [Amycolatopsis sp. EV170708-02-1]
MRISLLSLVRYSPGGEACFCDLAEEFDLPQPSLSQHLRVLVSAGILERERRGTWSWYSVVPEPLETLSDLLPAGGPLADRLATPHSPIFRFPQTPSRIRAKTRWPTTWPPTRPGSFPAVFPSSPPPRSPH